MRKPIIAANWKMNKAISESVDFVKDLKDLAMDIFNVEIVICPPFISLATVAEVLKDTNLKLGAQNMYWEKSGAFTGEISPVMLRDIGCHYVIVGHSERREYFKETDEDVHRKVKSAISFNLIPIMCLGEKLQERESGNTLDVVERQVKKGLDGLTKEEIKNLIIAYEPVWAIGTGKTASPSDANEVHKFIRSILKKLYDEEISSTIRIQYGGSVNPENIDGLMKEEEVDGVLVGGASLNINSFMKIIKGSGRPGPMKGGDQV
ncbi:triose-phosphate isomerase [Candidatus Desantisbacteria bacterium CG1_02_38_46]|uniref:Triosephosphate isomerase n=1 Tax=Candidatus Desantisbacteria bacterium CG1_02_38_46 TaxID=1817893 RepID=A0A1J4SBE2_9BACT|nr:MAG: triose-phosphate isomerase [Candidatus Desantisbacteria bacterium CG1_02_38_46]